MRYGQASLLMLTDSQRLQMLILVLSGRFPEYHEKYKHVLISDGNECYLKGIVFLGTPFRGSMKANQITPFISALSEINPFAMNVSLVRELRNIRDGTGDLQDISMNANIIITTWNIEVLVGCETQPVPSTGRGLVCNRSDCCFRLYTYLSRSLRGSLRLESSEIVLTRSR